MQKKGNTNESTEVLKAQDSPTQGFIDFGVSESPGQTPWS